MKANTEEELAVWSLFTPVPPELPLVAAANGVRGPEPQRYQVLTDFRQWHCPSLPSALGTVGYLIGHGEKFPLLQIVTPVVSCRPPGSPGRPHQQVSGGLSASLLPPNFVYSLISRKTACHVTHSVFFLRP